MAEEEVKSEEDMLAEWESMAADEADADAAGDGEVQGERILDQDEIDSLLGVDKDADKPKRGNEVLLDTSVVNYEKLPMLDHVFDKFERFLSTSLRHFTGDNVEVTIVGATSVRFGDYLNSVPLPAGMVIVKASGLDDFILAVYESQLIYAVVDILLGGRKSRPARVEGRTFTKIETGIINNLTDVVLAELSRAFTPVAPVKFTMDRMETNPRFAQITRDSNAAVLYTVRISLEGREGNVQFCLPYATLEPVRDQLLQQFMGEKFGQDNIWESHLSQELYHTNVPIAAVLDEMHMSLNEVLEWRLGDTIPLNARQNTPVRLQCGNVTKLVGSMGRAGDFKAVKVSHTVSDVNNDEESGTKKW
jgi:flagellar motor switch protein FliM